MSAAYRLFAPENSVVVTPADDGTHNYLGLFVGTGGSVKVDMKGTGAAIVFVSVPDGSFLPIQVSRVYSTDTTASNIVGLY